MSSLKLLTKGNLYSKKANDLKLLNEKDVLMPYSIIFNSDYNKAELQQVIKDIDAEYFYTRLSFADNTYPHHISKSVFHLNLIEELNKTFEQTDIKKRPNFDIIIQPIYNFEWSGAALIGENHILVEIVYGHPITLLRHGEYKYRFLIDRASQEIIDVTMGDQNTFLMWDRDKLVRSSKIIKSGSTFDQILSEIRKIRSIEVMLYEFGYKRPNFYYLECKPYPENSYLDIEQAYFTSPFTIYKNNEKTETNTIRLKLPALSEIEKLNTKNSILIENGAYLAHLATYSASNKIDCEFLQ